MVLECADRLILIDAGAMFPPSDLPGVDRIVPDFRYLRERRGRLEAVLLTHGHEDHIGGLAQALDASPAPVYGSRLALRFAKRRLDELGVEADLRDMKPGTSVSLGPFTVHPVRVAHSTSDSFALAIETPGGTVLASGDFKLDGGATDEERTDRDALAAWGRRGVRVLLADSTGAEQSGRTGGEDDVVPAFEDVFERTRGRVLVSCFATSIPRMQRVIDLADRHERAVGFVGRRMRDNAEVACELGLLRLPERVLPHGRLEGVPPSRQALFVSGSQGEPLSALSLVASGSHPALQVCEGDTTVLSARAIPGNERAVSRIISSLLRAGAEVVHPGTARVHVSGHGSRDDLAELIDLTRPDYVVPMHGEYRMLRQLAHLARDSGLPGDRVLVVEDGEALVVDADGARRDGDEPAGRVAIAPSSSDVLDDSVLRERRHLAREGVVVAIATRRRGEAALAAPSRVVSLGFVDPVASAPLLDEAAALVGEIVAGDETGGPEERAALEERVVREVRRLLKRRTRRRPLVLPVLVEV